MHNCSIYKHPALFQMEYIYLPPECSGRVIDVVLVITRPKGGVALME